MFKRSTSPRRPYADASRSSTRTRPLPPSRASQSRRALVPLVRRCFATTTLSASRRADGTQLALDKGTPINRISAHHLHLTLCWLVSRWSAALPSRSPLWRTDSTLPLARTGCGHMHHLSCPRHTSQLSLASSSCPARPPLSCYDYLHVACSVYVAAGRR